MFYYLLANSMTLNIDYAHFSVLMVRVHWASGGMVQAHVKHGSSVVIVSPIAIVILPYLHVPMSDAFGVGFAARTKTSFSFSAGAKHTMNKLLLLFYFLLEKTYDFWIRMDNRIHCWDKLGHRRSECNQADGSQCHSRLFCSSDWPPDQSHCCNCHRKGTYSMVNLVNRSNFPAHIHGHRWSNAPICQSLLCHERFLLHNNCQSWIVMWHLGPVLLPIPCSLRTNKRNRSLHLP